MRGLTVLCMVVAVGLAACGCTTNSGGVAPSTKPLDAGTYTLGARVSGTSWGVYIFGFIPVAFPETSEALDLALRESNGRPLVQVTTDTRHYYWPWPIVYLERIKVEGTATFQVPAAPAE